MHGGILNGGGGMIYFMEVGGMEEGGMRIPPYNWRSSIKNGGMEESYLICIMLCMHTTLQKDANVKMDAYEDYIDK